VAQKGKPQAMQRFWKGFFWGPPSHRRIAWIASAAGLIVLALPVVIAVYGTGRHPVFLVALAATGLAEMGWAIELLPTRAATLAGYGRLARWLCAGVGLVLAAICLVGQLAPVWFAGVLVVGALLLVVEMAPGGFANRP
jgi:hypothetical protein